MENEYWKDLNIEGGWYQISNLGRMRKNTLVHPFVDKKGYHRVYIRRKCYSIHRLVAESFIPNPDNKEQVNHIDSNPRNNKVENLEWVTPSENILHSYYQGNRNKLECYRVEDGKRFSNISKIAKEYNTYYAIVKEVIKKKNGKNLFSGKELEEKINRRKKRKNSVPVNAQKIKYIPTGKIYPSKTAAAKDLGFKSIYWLNKKMGKYIEEVI